MNIDLDHAGWAALLKSDEVRNALQGLALQIADQARSEVDPGVPVVVDSYTTDRAAVSVTIKDPRALALQAKHGTLTRAAGHAGLEVREKKS